MRLSHQIAFALYDIYNPCIRRANFIYIHLSWWAQIRSTERPHCTWALPNPPQSTCRSTTQPDIRCAAQTTPISVRCGHRGGRSGTTRTTWRTDDSASHHNWPSGRPAGATSSRSSCPCAAGKWSIAAAVSGSSDTKTSSGGGEVMKISISEYLGLIKVDDKIRLEGPCFCWMFLLSYFLQNHNLNMCFLLPYSHWSPSFATETLPADRPTHFYSRNCTTEIRNDCASVGFAVGRWGCRGARDAPRVAKCRAVLGNCNKNQTTKNTQIKLTSFTQM